MPVYAQPVQATDDGRALPRASRSPRGHALTSRSTSQGTEQDRYRKLILNAVEHGLSAPAPRPTNTHLRLLTRRSHDYHSPETLIVMADLTRGGLCSLPRRS